MSSSENPPGDAKRPALRVVAGGEPSADELAALVAVLSARAAAPAVTTSGRALREPLSPWVASGLVQGTRTRA